MKTREELEADVRRLTAEIENIRQVEFPKRIENVTAGWKIKCAKAEERATQAEQDLAALRALIVQYRDEPALYRKLIAAALKGETGNG
jgi:hypothetical protein